METDESTPLRVSEPDRSYVYMSARNRVYRSKVRQFQCCVCAGLLGVFVLAMIITVSYMVNHDIDDVPSDQVNTTAAPETPLQQLSTLLRSTGVFEDAENLKIPVTGYNSQELLAAFQKAEIDYGQRVVDEGSHPSNPLPPSHPSSLHQKVMYSSQTAMRASQAGQIIVAATKNIYKDKWQLGGWVGRGPRLPPSKWVSPEWCPDEDTMASKCWSASPYRTIDGTCNNLVHPEFGVAMKPFRRLMSPDYGDGISSPRKAKDGGELPSSREVSISVHRPTYSNDPDFTVVLAVWGQFVDHDFTATALSHRSDGQAITCCNTVWQHPECFPVPLAPGDPFYQQFNITCMDFVRSATAPTCSLGPREQLNQVTPYIDGSVVYGASKELMSELRTFTDGLLVSSRSADGRELLPVDRKLKDGCNQAEEAAKGRYCFKSGDARANENLHLTTLHLILARQHNKLAAILKEKNPTWSDEMLFQESRKIVGAQMQHVHYNEFVPTVLGRSLADELELTPKKSGYYDGYNSSVNPQIANEFAANAFRFGHTLMQGLMKMIADDKSSEEYVQLHKMLFNPFGLYESGYIDKAVRGATRTQMSKPDGSISPELQGNLFKSKTGPCGLDLVSLNIQRGRDHGLPAYPEWREYCGGFKPKTFEDLQPIMDSETVERLKAMYDSVDDIDPYTGLVSEIPVTTSGILGPTATCVIAEQFLRLKKGDRFWYETPQAPQAFTEAQLDEIRKTTLSSLLCDNTDELESVQPYSMAAISASNPITPCTDISRPNWDAWDSKPSIHLVQASGIRPRLFKTAEEQDKSLRDPTNPIDRIPQKGELVIGATAVAGSVTGGFEGSASDDVLWDGTLPLTIPSNLINHVLRPDGKPLTPLDPALIDHKAGILWTGTVDLIGSDRLELNADYFSVPIISGNGFTQKWWNGRANIQLNVFWNSSELIGQASGSFFTPIVLRSKTNSAEGVGAVPILSTGQVSSLRFPILLQGTFNWDRSLFFWNGNVTIIYPRPPKPVLTMSYEPTYRSTNPSSRLVIGATATRGSISGTYDGGAAQTLWDGSFPVSIPSPFLDQKLPPGTLLPSPDPATPIEHRGGAFWEGHLGMKDNGDLILSGDFSLPIFVYADIGLTAQKWWSGTFGITLSVNWNTTTIHDLPTGKYFSPLAFRKVSQFGPSHPYLFLTAINPNDLDSTAPATIPTFPVILQGDYNTDHSEFLWNGNVTLVFPKESPSVPLAPAGYHLLSAPAPSTFGTKPLIFGGNATLVSISKAGNEITWDATEPLKITIPQKIPGDLPILDIFHGGSSVFTGSIKMTAATKLSINGTFSVPVSNGSNPGVVNWQSGNIEAELDVTWNSTLSNSLIFENQTLRCMLFLKTSRTILRTKEPTPMMMKLMATGKKGPSSLPQCFIMLSGDSTDNKTLSWSGSYVAIILSPMVTQMAATSRVKRHAITIAPVVPHLRATRSSPNSAGYKMVLGGRVLEGKITASSNNGGPQKTLFQGSFPVTIPMPAFDRYLPRTTDEYAQLDNGPMFHGNGPIWAGSISYRTGTKIIELSGDFKFPLYIHGDNFTQEWWSGHAEMVVDVEWNSTNLELAPIISLPDADFYSPLRFRKDKGSIDASFQKSDPDLLDTSALPPPNEPNYPRGPMPKFPIILHGSMNDDKTGFSWNGKLTAVFPSSTRVVNAAKEIGTDSNTVDGLLLASSHSKMAGANAFGHKMVLGGRVIEGKISASSGGAPKRTLFHGSFPVAIPMPAFDRYLPRTSAQYNHTDIGPIFHGNGPIWAGSVSYRPGTKIIELYGDFRVPLYLHADTFTQEWWLGHAEMAIEVAWNSTQLDLAPIVSLPDADFYSPVRFRFDEYPSANADAYSSAQKIDPDMMNASPMQPPSEPFYPKGPMPKFPIILHGAMNTDRSAFLWYGNLTMVFPYSTATPAATLVRRKRTVKSKKKPAGNAGHKMVLGGSVVDGKITGSMGNNPQHILFQGALPVAIPMPAFDRYLPKTTNEYMYTETGPIFHGNGPIWSGSVSYKSGTKTLNFAGDFKFPIYIHGDNFTQEWWSGHADLVINVEWNSTSLESAPISSLPNADFYSPMRFQTEKVRSDADGYASVVKGNPDLMDTSPLMSPNEPNYPIGPMPKFPIILHGAMNEGKTSFMWNGKVTLVFPSSTPQLPIATLPSPITDSPETQLGLSHGTGVQASVPSTTIGHKMVLGGRVIEGLVSAASGGAPKRIIFHGSLPVSIPMPAFDRYLPRTSEEYVHTNTGPIFHGNGPIWAGSVSHRPGTRIIELYGEFRVPLYLHSNSFTQEWWLGHAQMVIEVAWNSTSLDLAPVASLPDADFYSPIRFRYDESSNADSSSYANAQKNDADMMNASPMQPPSEPFYPKGPMPKFPIILHGAMNTVRSAFLWNGNLTMVFPFAA